MNDVSSGVGPTAAFLQLSADSATYAAQVNAALGAHFPAMVVGELVQQCTNMADQVEIAGNSVSVGSEEDIGMNNELRTAAVSALAAVRGASIG